MTFLDLPWLSMTFHDFLWPSMTFYHFLRPIWPFMIKCLLSRPGLISGPLKPNTKLILTEFQGLTLSTPCLVPIISVIKGCENKNVGSISLILHRQQLCCGSLCHNICIYLSSESDDHWSSEGRGRRKLKREGEFFSNRWQIYRQEVSQHRSSRCTGIMKFLLDKII